MQTSNVQRAGVAQDMVATADFQHEIEQYLYREAALLDDREWDRWEALFADGGTYWVPLAHDQTDALNHASLFYEDAMMREVRRRRLNHFRRCAPSG